MTHYTTHKLTPELFEEWVKTRNGELQHCDLGIVEDYVCVPWESFKHSFLYLSGLTSINSDMEMWERFTLRLPVETKEQFAIVWLNDPMVLTKWRDDLEGVANYTGYFTRTIDSNGKVLKTEWKEVEK